MAATFDHSTQQLVRALAPRVLALISRRFGDFAAAEDAVQEALLAASTQWPREGRPDNPFAWLIHVASRRIADHLRTEAARRRREEHVVSLVPAEEQISLAPDEPNAFERDDTLDLLFMCCHRELSPSSAISLTLRAVGGLTTLEIASAFMVPEATMAQRISRAKQTVKRSALPLAMPSDADRAARLEAVTHVLYLMFNEGYAATSGDEVVRPHLSTEAIRLTRLLHGLLPDDVEVSGLLALMLLTDARRAARTGLEGELVTLEHQDRSRWNQPMIVEGIALLHQTLPRGAPGPYQVQAAIAALHDEAPSTAQTDWPQILALYSVLEQLTNNPVVSLNRAVALAMVEGPRAGLELIDLLASDARLEDNHRVDAVRAHLFERLGDVERAVALYRQAAERTTNRAERTYLLTHAAQLSDR